MKILNTLGESYPRVALDIVKELGEVDFKNPSQAELASMIGDYDAAVIGLGLVFNKEILEKAGRLKVIATATTGLDHIDLATAASRGVEVLSLRGEDEFLTTITGTSELAFGLLINLLRFLPTAFESVKKNEWDRDRFRGHNLYGKTLGILGMGRLGKWMARYGEAFGMNVIYADPKVELDPSYKYKKVSFEELIEASDVVSIHVHLAPDTENMFNAKIFAKMKQGACVINTARGKIVNEVDLLEALRSGRVAGYAADVLSDELNFVNKRFAENPLVQYAQDHNNVIITPHIGGMTAESRERTDVFMAGKLKRFLRK